MLITFSLESRAVASSDKVVEPATTCAPVDAPVPVL